jgi:glycosyltransferase involved in cell wall biosynthesis
MVVQIITRLALGGAQQIVYELTTRLKESDERVVVFTGHSKSASEGSMNNDIILNNIIEKKVAIRICKYFRNSISPLNDLLALFWLIRNLRELQPSIVHIHSSKAGILGRIACKIVGVDRVIYHVHGWSFSGASGVISKAYLFLERLFFYLTDHYIFVCRQDLIEFIDLGGNKKIENRSSIIYPGANFTPAVDHISNRRSLRKSLGLNEGDFVIGAIARLDYQKNPLFFFRFAAFYAKINKDVKFLWIGDGAQSDKVVKLIKEKGLEDRVILTGYIPDVESYYSVFDIFTITSRYEGLPVTSIKSLAAKVPVVSFLRNGMIDLDEKFDSFFGVPFEDMDRFIQAVDLAKLLIEECSDSLETESDFIRENWNMDAMCSEIISLYRQEYL